jgi:hypothetical protein
MLQYLHQSAMLSNYFDYKKAGSVLLNFFRQVSCNDYIVFDAFSVMEVSSL